MASVEEPTHSKRALIKTERMQEFIRSQGEARSQQKLLTCPKERCNKTFTSAPGLKYHIQTHCVTDPRFTCTKCQRRFKSANGLKYHWDKTRCEDVDHQVPGDLSQTQHEPTAREIDFNEASVEYEVPEQGRGGRNNEDEVKFTQSSHPGRLIPPPLDLSNQMGSERGHEEVKKCGVGMDKLTELAIIATSPQSPLLQKSLVSPVWDHSKGWVPAWDHSKGEFSVHRQDSNPRYSSKLELKNIPKVTELAMRQQSGCEYVPSDANGNYVGDGSDPRVSTSSPLLVSQEEEPLSSSTWSHNWPTAVWQCFIKGTLVKFLQGNTSDKPWQCVEGLAQQEGLSQQASVTSDPSSNICYAPDGLRVENITVCPRNSADQSNVCITFNPDHPGQPSIVAECRSDHPFFVKDKGWSSLHLEKTVDYFGIPCRTLCENDVCLPQSHKDATFSKEIFEQIKGFDFTPEDTSAVFVLNSMRKRKGSDLSPNSITESPKRESPRKDSPKKKRSDKPEVSNKAKRPMNAFMLFAKETRLELTQQFPGRDNRTISVMLGDQWRSLSLTIRQSYEDRAGHLAEQQKKKHPDCWKRKK